MKAKTLLAALAAFLPALGCSDGSDNRVPPSSLTLVPGALPEGMPGEMPSMAMRITLTEPQDTPVRVRYETSAGTATAGVDYLDTAGEVEIRAGDLEAFIPVEFIGDAEEEPAETFFVDIEVSDNAVPTALRATGTISNDDTACVDPFVYPPNPWLVNGADPLNFAHRGGVRDFPENTLYAYAEAALAGADVLEMDVYQTKDNQLVIIHDDTVDRTTNGTGRIIDLTLEELPGLSAEGILESVQFQQARMVPDACIDCPHAASCGGGCASRRALLGDLHRPDIYCPLIRNENLDLAYTLAAQKDLPRGGNVCTTIIVP